MLERSGIETLLLTLTARQRLFAVIAVGAVARLIAGWFVAVLSAVLIAWIVAAVTFLLWVRGTIGSFDADATKQFATRESVQPLEKINPVTSAIDCARGFALGDRVLYRVGDIHLSTALWHFALWWVIITVTFRTLAVRRYHRGEQAAQIASSCMPHGLP